MNKLNGLGVFVCSIFFSQIASAHFLPESALQHVPQPKGPSNISQDQFNAIISQLQTLYGPIIAQLGGRLTIEPDWTNDKIVAQSAQSFGLWQIQISGGLARRPELSPDGLSLILCHELGHHVGGFPYMDRGLPIHIPIQLPGGLNDIWAAAEGMADYYASEVCAKKLWANDLELNATFKDQADPTAKDKCDIVWHTEAERNLCYRTVTGIKKIMATMTAILQQPATSFDTPDPGVVTATNPNYPAVQCRMDTSFSGALCTAAHDDTLIPGKKSDDFPYGLDTERDASKYYCTQSGSYMYGRRPACWFKDRL